MELIMKVPTGVTWTIMGTQTLPRKHRCVFHRPIIRFSKSNWRGIWI